MQKCARIETLEAFLDRADNIVESPDPMSRRFTRQEFYDLVWSKPLTHLAKEFGLSDVALHKVCRKHNIPKPPVGWWAKVAAGKKVQKVPLPDLKAGGAETIVISESKAIEEPEPIACAREQARAKVANLDVLAEPRAHPIVSRSMAKLRKAKPDYRGLVPVAGEGLISIEIAPASIDRIELGLNRIVAAARTLGFDLVGKSERAAFTDGAVSIPFHLKETYRRTKHEPTEAELAAQEKKRQQRQRQWGRMGWDHAPDYSYDRSWPDWGYTPTGMVAFEFDIYLRHASQVRKLFKDGKRQQLESMAPEIAAGLSALVAGKHEDDRLAEEARLQAEEEARRRNEARRRAYIEERRGKALALVVERLDRRNELRKLVAELTADLAESPAPRTAEFLRWATKALENAEWAMSVETLEALFAREEVFGDKDDHGFYPTRHGW